MEEDIGLSYVKEPPKGFQGETKSQIMPDVRFYFESQEQADFVYEMFKDGSSRIPSGKKLLDFIKKYTGQEPEQNTRRIQGKL